jgi:hypothetical protein
VKHDIDDYENHPMMVLNHLNSFATAEKGNTPQFMATSHGINPINKGQLMERGHDYLDYSRLSKSSHRVHKSNRKSHSPYIKRTLKSWLFQHIHHPYPTADEKEVLRIKTGLTNSQLNDWFTNARRRDVPKMKQEIQIKTGLTASQLDDLLADARRRGVPKMKQNKHRTNSSYHDSMAASSLPNMMEAAVPWPQYQMSGFDPQSVMGLQTWPMNVGTSSLSLPDCSVVWLNSMNSTLPTNNYKNSLLLNTILCHNTPVLPCSSIPNTTCDKPTTMSTYDDLNESKSMDMPMLAKL